ncbi:MAG: META domain-containing protein [Flavobacteriales bacterium]|nr:META domain-containing protein [Flavobacteriales bacterium]MCB9167514.1 META domain-containing protein [Flavobacteriales bacterium]
MWRTLLLRSWILVLWAPLLSSIVFKGVVADPSGTWHIDRVFDDDLGLVGVELELRILPDGRVEGRSECGTFTGRWAVVEGHMRFAELRPGVAPCGYARLIERKLFHALEQAEGCRRSGNRLYLMSHERHIVVLRAT